MNRRQLLAGLGLAGGISLAGCIDLAAPLADDIDDDEQEGTPSTMRNQHERDTNPLGASGSLQVRNGTDNPHHMTVSVTRHDLEDPLFELDTRVAPGDRILGEETLSGPGQYHLEAHADTQTEVRDWDVTGHESRLNVLVRIAEDDGLDVMLLRPL